MTNQTKQQILYKGEVVRIKKEYLHSTEASDWNLFILLTDPTETDRVDIKLVCNLPLAPIERLSIYMIEAIN